MRLLLVHNSYRQRGGEDAVYEAERVLLQAHGHDVETLEFHNTSIATRSPLDAARMALTTVWSRSAAAHVEDAVRRHRSEVVHFHNTFPLVSPAAYWAARRAGAAVVQTLHNYRMLCPDALFYRDRRPCEDCQGRSIAWPGVLHACYHDSRAQTAVIAAMQSVHRALGTWRHAVDCYIALTRFSRSKFVAAGLPEERILVKPNFIGNRPSPRGRAREGFLFLGRLDDSKGIHELLEAWAGSPRPHLRIAGDGPLRADVAAAAERSPHIEYLGYVGSSEVPHVLETAQALVFPSRWYEACPLAIVEAFAAGTPVIASRLGAMAEIVDDGRTGLLFRAGDAVDLAAKVASAAADPVRLEAMGRAARSEYEAKYDAGRNYELLIEVYGRAIELRTAKK